MVLIISRHGTTMGRRLLCQGNTSPLNKQGLPLWEGPLQWPFGNHRGEGPVPSRLSAGTVIWGRDTGSL